MHRISHLGSWFDWYVFSVPSLGFTPIAKHFAVVIVAQSIRRERVTHHELMFTHRTYTKDSRTVNCLARLRSPDDRLRRAPNQNSIYIYISTIYILIINSSITGHPFFFPRCSLLGKPEPFRSGYIKFGFS